MSARSKATDWTILIGLAVLTVGVLGWMSVSGWLDRPAADELTPRTTTSPARRGTLAYYMLLERMGLGLRRHHSPLHARALARWDVLFCIEPVVELTSQETVALKRWVRGGGVLVCTPEMAEGVGWTTGYFGPLRGMADVGQPGEPYAVPDDVRSLPLARDVRALCLAGSSTLNALEADRLAPPTAPTRALLVDAAGVRIARRRMGAGRVIALADSSFLANRLIGEADNAVLAAGLAAYALHAARGRRAAWDEYHLGYGRGPTRWTTMAALLTTTPAGWGVFVATAAGVLLLLNRGRRFGTRRGAARVRRRSRLEYVRSVGATYRAARAHRLTLRVLLRAHRARCAARVGLPEGAEAAQVAEALGRRLGRPARRYLDVWGRCALAAGGGRLSSRELARLLAALADVEREVLDGRASRE
jgi:hypothetical protein